MRFLPGVVQCARRVAHRRGFVGTCRHLLGCTIVGAPSSRSDSSAPSSTYRFSLTGLLGGRVRRLRISSVRLASGYFLCKGLPTAGKCRDTPTVNFVTRVSAMTSCYRRPVHPVVARGCGNGRLTLNGDKLALDPGVFPRLRSLGKRALVAASKGAVLKTSSGTKVTRVVALIRRLRGRSVPRNPVSVTFAPSRRVNAKTSRFSIRLFNTSFTCALSNSARKRLRCRGFGTYDTSFSVRKMDIRPNSTGSAVVGTYLLTVRVGDLLPLRRAPHSARKCRNFCRLVGVGNSYKRTALGCVIQSRSARGFRCEGSGLVSVAGRLGGG